MKRTKKNSGSPQLRASGSNSEQSSMTIRRLRFHGMILSALIAIMLFSIYASHKAANAQKFEFESGLLYNDMYQQAYTKIALIEEQGGMLPIAIMCDWLQVKIFTPQDFKLTYDTDTFAISSGRDPAKLNEKHTTILNEIDDDSINIQVLHTILIDIGKTFEKAVKHNDTGLMSRTASGKVLFLQKRYGLFTEDEDISSLKDMLTASLEKDTMARLYRLIHWVTYYVPRNILFHEKSFHKEHSYNSQELKNSLEVGLRSCKSIQQAQSLLRDKTQEYRIKKLQITQRSNGINISTIGLQIDFAFILSVIPLAMLISYALFFLNSRFVLEMNTDRKKLAISASPFIYISSQTLSDFSKGTRITLNALYFTVAIAPVFLLLFTSLQATLFRQPYFEALSWDVLSGTTGGEIIPILLWIPTTCCCILLISLTSNTERSISKLYIVCLFALTTAIFFDYTCLASRPPFSQSFLSIIFVVCVQLILMFFAYHKRSFIVTTLIPTTNVLFISPIYAFYIAELNKPSPSISFSHQILLLNALKSLISWFY